MKLGWFEEKSLDEDYSSIDGINSNWVKVEVIFGRDRDCKDIKKKMTGWCYGGYLE